MRRALLAAGVFYAGSYVFLRSTRAEVWSKDGKTYVLFPGKGTYYLYRPLSLADAALTGMSFHIGPHR